MSRNITELVAAELAPFLAEHGYVLYGLEFVKEQKEWYLRVAIEKAPSEPGGWPGNVGTDDCEIVSRFLSDRLDALDPIEQNYYLEVSSPGMDRALRKEEDFQRYRGSLVDVKLYEGIAGKKSWTGTLDGHDEANVSLALESGEILRIPRAKISKIKLAIVL